MDKLSNFKILETIENSPYISMYRVVKGETDEKRLLSLISTENASPSQIARAKQELERIIDISLPGIVGIDEIRQIQGSLMIIQENFEGQSLKSLIKRNPVDMDFFLNIGISIATTIKELHNIGIIHNAISAENILVNLSENQTKLFNFNQLNLLAHEGEGLFGSRELKKLLPYISPERSGRVSQAVDYRSDLYSIGVVFYEMLTGHPPFLEIDPLALIYAHIARKPIPINDIKRDIPRVISEIILKLLSKSVEERYQSGFGLMQDLQECLSRFQKTGKITFFKPAQKDLPIMFKTPDRLFGRKKEQEELAFIFNRARQGERLLVFVLGPAGIGKSALIQELHRLVAGCQGFFISGKFEQTNPDVPYNAIFQALKRLIRQILSQSRDKIKNWEEKLIDTLGPNSGLITDIIPDTTLIIGKQPKVPVLSPEEAQNRFYLVIKKFINVFATAEHPLVMFLDDMQWADSASLGLLTSILCDQHTKHFLFIGAFRDNEIPPNHPLIKAQAELAISGIDIHQLLLAPLNVNHVNQFLTECLHCSFEKSRALSELVHRKTGGNPFFVKQFMETVNEMGLLNLDPVTGWNWNVEEIDGIDETHNVIILMASKIARLPQKTQELLKICACFGNRFNLESVSEFTARSIEDTITDLKEAIREGLVTASSRYYKFAHDNIYESVYQLIPEFKRKEIHHRIGTYPFTDQSDSQLTGNIFFTVNQLNLAKELLNEIDEKDQLANSNLLAGKEAKASTAYSLAFNYLKTGIDLVGHSGWERNYALTFSLYTEAVEAAYLSTAFNDMETLAKQVDLHAKTLLEKVSIYTIRLKTLLAQNKLRQAVATGIAILKELGLHFPEKPKFINLLSGILKTKLRLLKMPVENLADLQRMESPLIIAQLKIMSTVAPAVYWAEPNLLPVMVFKMVRLMVKFGNTAMSPYNYAGYGLILCGIGEIEKGYRFGKMALQLMERMAIREQKAKTLFVFNGFIRHWKEPVKDTLSPLLSAYQSGVEAGDFEFAAFSLQLFCFHSFCASQSLDQLDSKMREYIDIIKSLKQEPQLYMTRLHHQVVMNLKDNPKKPWMLEGECYDEKRMLPLHQQAGDRTILFTLYFYKLMLCFLFEKHDTALEYAKKAEALIEAVMSTYIVATFYFFDALNRLALYRNTSTPDRPKILWKAKKNLKQLSKWSRHAPTNFQHHCVLVKAEILSVRGDTEKAATAYNRAIQLAQKNGFEFEEALANELSARHYTAITPDGLAGYYQNEALQVYAHWGARSKTVALKETGQKLWPSQKHTDALSLNRHLDYSTIVHSIQAISTEIILSDLLKKLTKIIAGNAGADKVLFISVKGEKLFVAAEWFENPSGPAEPVTLPEAFPADERPDLLVSLVNYVKRTKEYMVLDDAQRQGDYTNDPYVLEHAPKSVLCLPIIRKSDLAGILYMENTAAPGVFTLERIETLQLLASQAAISLENASLYENLATTGKAMLESERKYRKLNVELEQRVCERTAELQQSLETLKSTQEQLINTEKLAALGSMVAGVAHEINTPIGIGLVASSLLEEKTTAYRQLSSEGKLSITDMNKYMKIAGESSHLIYNNLQKAADLVNSFKQAASEQSGRQYRWINVKSYLDELKDGLQPKLEENGHQVHINCPQDLKLYSDPGHLYKLFTNLIMNSILHGFENKQNGQINIVIQKESDWITVHYRDNGKGMDSNVLQKLYNPFFTTKRSKGNTGLGMHILYNMISQTLGGTIECKSESGEGVRFRIRIPITSSGVNQGK